MRGVHLVYVAPEKRPFSLLCFEILIGLIAQYFFQLLMPKLCIHQVQAAIVALQYSNCDVRPERIVILRSCPSLAQLHTPGRFLGPFTSFQANTRSKPRISPYSGLSHPMCASAVPNFRGLRHPQVIRLPHFLTATC